MPIALLHRSLPNTYPLLCACCCSSSSSSSCSSSSCSSLYMNLGSWIHSKSSESLFFVCVFNIILTTILQAQSAKPWVCFAFIFNKTNGNFASECRWEWWLWARQSQCRWFRKSMMADIAILEKLCARIPRKSTPGPFQISSQILFSSMALLGKLQISLPSFSWLWIIVIIIIKSCCWVLHWF